MLCTQTSFVCRAHQYFSCAGGHPEGIVYPSLKEFDMSDYLRGSSLPTVTSALVKFNEMCRARSRVIGWSLNTAKPGHQLDLILKK